MNICPGAWNAISQPNNQVLPLKPSGGLFLIDKLSEYVFKKTESLPAYFSSLKSQYFIMCFLKHAFLLFRVKVRTMLNMVDVM